MVQKEKRLFVRGSREQEGMGGSRTWTKGDISGVNTMK